MTAQRVHAAAIQMLAAEHMRWHECGQQMSHCITARSVLTPCFAHLFDTFDWRSFRYLIEPATHRQKAPHLEGKPAGFRSMLRQAVPSWFCAMQGHELGGCVGSGRSTAERDMRRRRLLYASASFCWPTW